MKIQKTRRNKYFLSAGTRLKPKRCARVYLLQGRERGVAMSEIKSSVGEAESGQVSQSQILWQRKTLGQTGLLTLIYQLLHLCVQTQICRTHVEKITVWQLGNMHRPGVMSSYLIKTLVT